MEEALSGESTLMEIWMRATGKSKDEARACFEDAKRVKARRKNA
jgi:hypothetical protein